LGNGAGHFPKVSNIVFLSTSVNVFSVLAAGRRRRRRRHRLSQDSIKMIMNNNNSNYNE
jgi:hypothetical protein